jgi:hypothetical protein
MCVVAILAAPFLTVVHDITVKHTVCADHGELLEGLTRPDSGVPSAPTNDPERERNQHCDFGLHVAAKTIVLVAVLLFAVPEISSLEVRPRIVAQGPPAESVLEYAPKNSPPLS